MRTCDCGSMRAVPQEHVPRGWEDSEEGTQSAWERSGGKKAERKGEIFEEIWLQIWVRPLTS